jgi:helix-hairpin-helix protein
VIRVADRRRGTTVGEFQGANSRGSECGRSAVAKAPTQEFSITPSLTRGRVLAACSIVILALALLFIPAAAADRPSGGGQLVLWLLRVRMAQEHEDRKIDINSATVEELRALPGIERHHALRIIGQRPYAKLQDLARAGLSPITIERLARFLAVDPDWPSALLRPSTVPHTGPAWQPRDAGR